MTHGCSLVWGAGDLAYVVNKSSGAVSVYHTDGLGSTRAITDNSGSVVQTYQTDEFGVPTQTQGGVGQPFGFTGEPHDPEDGLIYLRARMYDPLLGRFISRDPTYGFAQSPLTLNPYAYAEGNPMVIEDPSGYFGFESQPGGPGRCAPPGLPAALQFLWDNSFCRDPDQTSKTERQLDYRPELQCGGWTVQSFDCIAAARGEGEERDGSPPPNLSPPGAGRRGAFRQAKRDLNLPVSQQPYTVGRNQDRLGNIQPGRQYTFVDKNGNQVVIRDDAAGHDYGFGDPQNRGPHFNTPDGGHYDYGNAG